MILFNANITATLICLYVSLCTCGVSHFHITPRSRTVRNLLKHYFFFFLTRTRINTCIATCTMRRSRHLQAGRFATADQTLIFVLFWSMFQKIKCKKWCICQWSGVDFFQKWSDCCYSFRELMHKCWACDVSVLGLEQFRIHINTHEHKNNLNSLKQRREKGFTLEYNYDELKPLCAQRDRNRHKLK